MKKISRYSLIAAAIIISFVIGSYVGYVVSNTQTFAEELIIVSKLDQYLEITKANGSDKAYEEALISSLDVLKSLQGKKHSLIFTESVIATDLALTHARLAILYEKRRDIKSKADHLNLIHTYCPKTGITNCTVEGITEMVKQLDN